MKNAALFFLALLRACCVISFVAAAPAFAEEVTLEDNSMLVAFDSHSGALTRLENKTTGWDIEQRPQLGLSFRLDLLLPNHKEVMVEGREQNAVSVRKISSNLARLQWNNLRDENGSVLPITFTANVTLADGKLTFAATLKNQSPLMVKFVEFPCFGDLSRAPDGAPLRASHLWYGNLQSAPVAPAQTIETWQSLFCLIQSPAQGIYVDMADPTQPYLIDFNFQQPGSAKSAADPLRVQFHARHFIYAHPHSTRKLAPIVIQCYSGDWHAGVDLYKAWRATWFKPPPIPDWVRQLNSWQQVQINSPVQDYRVPFTNLLSYAQQCADNGVGAIQLVGWNKGGQDGGLPSCDPDPGLGTWQQLHDAIAQMQAKGVHIVLFAKLNFADLTTDWYSNELYKYECLGEDGKKIQDSGCFYYTPAELAGIGTHRRASLDFLDPAYCAIARQQFQKVLSLGSAGWLWDEVCHHDGAVYTWSPNHGHPVPGYNFAGDMPLDRRLWVAAKKSNPQFLFAGEAPGDWLLQYFPCSYFRIGADSVPVCRYLDPQAPLMVAVTGFDDRDMLNLILMDRYIISYEPFNFKGYLDDFPLTLAYGKKIDALRRKYHDYLWDATFRDTLGATVTATGSYRYSVFVTASGKRAVVVVNTELAKSITAKVELPRAGKLVMATPEQPDAVPSDGTLDIPVRSAAVVMEQ